MQPELLFVCFTFNLQTFHCLLHYNANSTFLVRRTYCQFIHPGFAKKRGKERKEKTLMGNLNAFEKTENLILKWVYSTSVWVCLIYCVRDIPRWFPWTGASPGILGLMKKYYIGLHNHRPSEPCATAVATSPGPIRPIQSFSSFYNCNCLVFCSPILTACCLLPVKCANYNTVQT